VPKERLQLGAGVVVERGDGMLEDERRLLERLRVRDEAAFNELVRCHQGPVFRLLERMLGDAAEAEDVAQEVFVSVFKSIESFRGDSALGTWLYRIAANHGKNRLKYLARRRRDAARPVEDAGAGEGATEREPTPSESLEGRQAEANLRRAFEALDEEQRLLVTLRDMENMSYEEIRVITELPIGTVKSKLHRARLSLHERFTELQRGVR
jgi:RNA polymerase sigma-70 factor (ECF subfamily)